MVGFAALYPPYVLPNLLATFLPGSGRQPSGSKSRNDPKRKRQRVEANTSKAAGEWSENPGKANEDQADV